MKTCLQKNSLKHIYYLQQEDKQLKELLLEHPTA